jgi:hypothetical protein
MGRTHHLKETLLQNIKDNLPENPGDPAVEFVLVDYNSKDGLKEWIESNKDLKPYLDNKTLVYARYPDAKHFHHAHAKNMAHRLATGDVVCNLDADNFTGKGFARSLADKFADGKSAIVHPAFKALKGVSLELSGAFGRIAMLRKDFLALGGYSETRFNKGWGSEDTDLIRRALAYGLNPRPIFEKAFLKVIAHGNEERLKYTAAGMQGVQKIKSGRLSFNQLRFTFKTYTSSVQENPDGHFGMGTVFGIDNKARAIEAVESMPSISRGTIHAFLPMRKDHAMKRPAQTAGA